MINIRLLITLAAAAIAAVVIAYGIGRWLIISGLLTAISTLTGCQTPVPVRQCPEIPQISPVLSVTPQPIFRERLKKVWILPQNAMN